MRPARSREARGDHAAERGARPVVRRLEGEHLAVRGKLGFELGKRRSRPCRDDELAGRIRHDAGDGAQVERLADERPAIEVLRASATQAQRPALGDGRANALLDGGDGGVDQREASLSR